MGHGLVGGSSRKICQGRVAQPQHGRYSLNDILSLEKEPGMGRSRKDSGRGPANAKPWKLVCLRNRKKASVAGVS